MGRLVQVGVGLVVVALLVAIVDYVANPSGSPVRSAVRTVIDGTTKQYDRLTGQPTAAPAGTAATAKPEPPPAPARRRPAGPAPSVEPPPPPVVDAAPAALGTPAAASPAEVPATALSGLRQFYLPGRVASWTRYDIAVTGPVAIRAAGRISVGESTSSPAGVAGRGLDSSRQPSSANDRALPGAPFLALIGRVCSGESCSEPFLVGSDYVVCPSDVKITGHLQLWTNNNIRVGGVQTSQAFSSVVGGYSFSTEAAPVARCGTEARRTPAASTSSDARTLASGRTLESQQYVVPSSQSSWKPFFLPLNLPIVIRASGTMRPRNGATPTGPEGIAVPNVAQWSYPGARDLVVDQEHRLYDPAMPYQALIGRVCEDSGCAPAFVVGRERLLCPSGPGNGWLELWINHIISPAGLLGSRTTLSLDAFDLQTRVGEYRFSASPAPGGACAGR